jgi:hypothetical protein
MMFPPTCCAVQELTSDNARYAYVYAIALNSTGAPAEAMALSEGAHWQHQWQEIC